jgi:hypothetical protein
MSEWDGLKTFDDWKAKLDALLVEARQASTKNDDEARLDLCARLRQFVQKSRPNTPEVLELDRLASEAQQALSEQIAEDAIGRIEARTTEILLLAKRVEQVARKAEEDAATLRLDRAHAAVDALTDVVRALDDFDDVLQDGTDEELSGRIKEILAAARKLRDSIEKKA